MDKISVCSCVLVLILLFEHCLSDSGLDPCPGIFNYYNNGKTLYGLITLVPVETVSSLNVSVRYTVQIYLNDDELGDIDRPKNVLEMYNRGEPVVYLVTFPLSDPPPKVTDIVVNGVTICSGPGDIPIDRPISHRTLQITTKYPGGSSPPYRRFSNQTSGFSQNGNNSFGINDKDPTYTSFSARQSVEDWISKLSPGVEPKMQQYSLPVTMQPRPVERDFPSTTTDECGLVDGGNQIQPLVYQGMSYERGEIPWHVAIFKSNPRGLSFICGGALVSDRHVITAAHCKQTRRGFTNNKDIVVQLGIHKLNAWGDEFTITTKILNATIHESYGSNSLQNDIMVLTLIKRVKFNKYIRPACLWSGDTELSHVVGATGVVAGWGETDTNEQEEPHMVRVTIVSTKDCRASHSFFHQVTFDTTLCAGDKNGAGPCKGDSGGGLYIKEGGKWRLRGITSLALQSENGGATCHLNEYVIYTDTAQYLPWIRNILSQKYFD